MLNMTYTMQPIKYKIIDYKTKHYLSKNIKKAWNFFWMIITRYLKVMIIRIKNSMKNIRNKIITKINKYGLDHSFSPYFLCVWSIFLPWPRRLINFILFKHGQIYILNDPKYKLKNEHNFKTIDSLDIEGHLCGREPQPIIKWEIAIALAAIDIV